MRRHIIDSGEPIEIEGETDSFFYDKNGSGYLKENITTKEEERKRILKNILNVRLQECDIT